MFSRGRARVLSAGASPATNAAAGAVASHPAAMRKKQQQQLLCKDDEEQQDDFKFNVANLKSIDDGEDDDRQHFLTTKPMQHNKSNNNNNKQKSKDQFQIDYYNSDSNSNKRRKAKLAKQETIEEEELDKMRSGEKFSPLNSQSKSSCFSSCFKMLVNFIKRKRIFIPLIIICCIAAIYCLPFIEIQPAITKQLPHIPFNYDDGPLRSSSISQFKLEHLFYDQVHGPESVAIDSVGNMYLAIEGGFILYAHLNKSAPIKRAYYANAGASTTNTEQQLSPQLMIRSPSTLLYTTPNTLIGEDNVVVVGANNNNNEQQKGTITTTKDSIDLIKIAELNGIKQIAYDNRRRARGDTSAPSGGHWQRECLLDEKFYGTELYSGGVGLVSTTPNNQQVPSANYANTNFYSNDQQQQQQQNEATSKSQQHLTAKTKMFVSNVLISRCSKPLGIRLSPDESYLYVVDTLSGLYRVSLKVSERPNSTQRLVTKLIDFRNNKKQALPVVQLDNLPTTITTTLTATTTTTTTTISSQQQTPGAAATITPTVRAKSYLNVSLTAVDDLVIDYGAGTRGGDIIYLTVGSQSWMAVSVLYDVLEGRPSGLLLRYDSGSNQLSVLDPSRVAHVRTSPIVSTTDNNNNNNNINSTSPSMLAFQQTPNSEQSSADVTTTADGSVVSKSTRYLAARDVPYLGIGAPHLDENDLFDDRPLHFPNGLELTADRSALLIADTINKRILKHYIKGPRKGTTDLWAWTPNFPDNIRRGHEKHGETYWVVGCSQDSNNMIAYLNDWPSLRKYLLKNIYLIGWIIETFGHYIIGSTSVRDFGYSFKIGHSIIEKTCAGMMILQYNKYGDIIRSIYSKEFPNDVMYYSQVNEVIDAINQEHILYLSSPAYNYVTKIILPTNSFPDFNSQPATNPTAAYFEG